MPNVWVVNNNDQDDYSPIAVYTDENLAELYARPIGAGIGEFELNPCAAELQAGLRGWAVWMSWQGRLLGTVEPAHIETAVEGHYDKWAKQVQVFVLAHNKKEAIKKAQERRKELILQGKGG